jgi:hypothetical protein
MAQAAIADFERMLKSIKPRETGELVRRAPPRRTSSPPPVE